ncbi:NAD-dependent DNA ligase LigA [Helicobacter sp. MIT 14-3879]|uniref:NAD-dependent DNA ligase LigA n=1 Tax=Helicobacter sp. MIT 14-3879 TaxID=2040649 RepID=UPI000E1EDC39|nr:DNA ligase (NAD(+)) LigA [Helicobacter sp. MIT 14-3879]
MDYETYIQKVSILKKMAYHYYVLDEPIASDDEYDKTYNLVLEFEKANPNKIDSTSPTQRVGDVVIDSFEKSQHIEKMWSLEDVFNNNELNNWINRIYKNTNFSAIFMCDAKFDGASLNLLYENGKLISAATRGDGNIGEQVLHNAKAIKSIPLSIPYNDKIEIRGEVVIQRDTFDSINKKRLQKGESIFANPRNAAAGSLRQLDSTITKERRLKFIPWGFGFCNIKNNSFFERLDIIKSFGFIDTKLSAICKNIDEIEVFYKKLVSLRDDYPIMLDGMVIRLDSVELQDSIGYTIKNPRFAVAYKFPAIEKQTKILSVTFQVGRSGLITPVAELEGIHIDGAKISRATLHNFDEIEKKDIRINDNVLIIRSGDVIPKIIKPLVELRNGGEIIISKPTHCPICNSELLIENILIKCQNLNCKGRVINSIIHFCSKKAMNIVGMGDRIVEFLFENKLINNILDIYSLKYEDLEGIESWQNKKINNLLNAINSSKNTSLWRFINALGIEHIGEGSSKKLVNIFGERIFEVSFEELITIDGIGEEMAKSLVLFMQTNKEFITSLLQIINIKKDLNVESKLLLNEVIVLTGTMSKSRDIISKELEALGASISSNVGKKTTMLVYGENAGSKLSKARELNIKIISEYELNEILKS